MFTNKYCSHRVISNEQITTNKFKHVSRVELMQMNIYILAASIRHLFKYLNGVHEVTPTRVFAFNAMFYTLKQTNKFAHTSQENKLLVSAL